MKAIKAIRLKQEAKKVYNWLWWSPLLTIPTLYYFLGQNIGFDVICSGIWQNCNFNVADRLTILFAIPISALWHLLFLRKAFNNESDIFVRWHARQALFLAGMRTAIPLVIGLWSGESGITMAILIIGILWLLGTSWGQRQAARGDCWLMRKRGLVAELAVYQQVEEETSIGIENLLEMLEDNLTLNRQKAAVGLGKLEEIDEEAIKALQRVAALDPNVHVREAAQKALQAPVHQNYLANKLAKTPPDQSESTLPSTDPQTDYEQAVAFLNARDRDKAVEKFALAFRMGGRNLRAQALAQLETLDEVEVF